MPDEHRSRRGFFDELVTNLAKDPHCNGVIVAVYDGPSGKRKNVAMAWTWGLLVDYSVGEPKQARTLEHGLQVFFTGTGDAKDVASMICSVMTERGARVLN